MLEHFADEAGEHQLMVHSVFGGRVNRGLEMLLRHLASQRTGLEVRSYGEDDGLLLMLLGERDLPDGLLNGLDPASAPGLLRALLPQSPLFSMVFRYNAAQGPDAGRPGPAAGSPCGCSACGGRSSSPWRPRTRTIP